MSLSIYVSVLNNGLWLRLIYMIHRRESHIFCIGSPLPLESRHQKRVTRYTFCTNSRFMLRVTKACAGNSFVPDRTGPSVCFPASVASFVGTIELSSAFRTGLQYHTLIRSGRSAGTAYTLRVFRDFRTEIALLPSGEMEILKIVAEIGTGTNNLSTTCPIGVNLSSHL